MLLLQKYIKQTLAEAISQDSAYKAKIKSLFEQWINKLSASYLAYRKQNYPDALTVSSVSYSESFQYQHIILFFIENYADYALAFEHEGSICIANDKALSLSAFATVLAAPPIRWHKRNWSFKLSVSEFQIALDVADNYDEFIALCSQLNVKQE